MRGSAATECNSRRYFAAAREESIAWQDVSQSSQWPSRSSLPPSSTQLWLMRATVRALNRTGLPPKVLRRAACTQRAARRVDPAAAVIAVHADGGEIDDPAAPRLEHVADRRPREVRVREFREFRVHASPFLFGLFLLFSFLAARAPLERPVLEVGLGEFPL